ncbi:hypothetical protein F2P56_011729 [Juglans regia]|uniref:TMV resistance protein N-like n=2 Tax=Juglans regia TaxID=51240 RepID=A0A6P9EGC8_JUGRE|nr:TMV resistance protein N-like [Juglans regia]KAF5471286.1 hypothetical protein F2P56_011729 [Juglans regia]
MATQTPSSSTPEVSKKRKRDNSSSSRWKHEVFLSFYGKDTRTSFTDHLYADLKRKGILVFRDDEALQRGEDISKALRKAIQKSQYGIVILSKNYTSSKWCLRELAEIVEWEKNTKLIKIIPIFYYVDPSDVRNQRGTFAKAFAAHEKDPKVDIKEIKMWKKAFSKVGDTKGEHIHQHRYESTIIQDISRRITQELNSRFSSHDYDKLVAIDSQVDKMMELLDMESNDVRFVGIHGMGGVGKTTLAQIIYYRVSNSCCRFEGSSFISCIREESKARGLASLQKQLLSMIMQEEIHVWDQNEGDRMRKKMLSNKRVFIVLDDVDSDEQLTALAGDRKWFGPGSRVIITSRDGHLLKRHGVNDIYEVERLQKDEALQLFSLSAFDKTHPPENYKDLSMDFVKYAQGLPLALNVLGCFLRDRTIDAWKSERDKLKAIPNPKIMDVLQISFDGLEDSQKELFLDMACLSRGQHWVDNTLNDEMLFESFGHYRIDLDVLVEKSLIRKSNYGWLSMHDLLEELGREIVRRECRRDHPGGRSRLFCVEDLYHVLETDTGTDATKAILVHSCAETKDQIVKAKAFSKMRKLRYLKFPDSRTIQWSGDPLKYMPTNELRFLEWPGYHLKTLPSSFPQKNLTVLRMSRSRIKQLWKGSMVLPNLKFFDLSYSKNLIETPDLTGVPNLETIYLLGCRRLCELHPSIGSLKKLYFLLLDKCSSLEKLPDLSRRMECLTHLLARGTAITQIPSVKSNIDACGLWFRFSGSKLMRLKSRDPIYDIGSLVEYQKEGTYDYIEAKCIDFDSKAENILDMAGVVISALDDDLNMISGWSLGFHMIPEWVQYKSNGSFVKIDLDANTNPEMGLAFFIVCDSDHFLGFSSSHDYGPSISISSLFKSPMINLKVVRLTIVFETDEEYYVEYDCSSYVSFGKRIGFWVYIPAVLRLLDIRRVIKISFKTGWNWLSGKPCEKEVEVKECGVHLVFPDDANSKFYNSIASFGRLGFSNSNFHRKFEADMMKDERKEKKGKGIRKLKKGGGSYD